MSLHVAVVGAGALGLYYGGLLCKHRDATGVRVSLFVRSDYDALTRRGLIVRSIDGDFTLPPAAFGVYRDPARLRLDAGPVDVVLLGLKTTANATAYDKLIPPLYDSKYTVILCLQNGIGNEENLARRFEPERILGGTAFLCSNRVAPGEIEHTEHGMVHLAPYLENFQAASAEATPEAIRELFSTSGVDCHVRPNYVEMRWRKQIWNVPFNALCTLYDQTTDQLLATQGMPDRIAAIMHETIELGRRVNAGLEKINPTLPPHQRIRCGEYRLAEDADAIVAEQLAKTATMGAYKPSMLIDARAGRPIEYDTIVAACLRERDRHAPDFRMPEIERLADGLGAMASRV